MKIKSDENTEQSLADDLDAQLQKRTREIADLKRRICDELYTYPAYALLETLISLKKSYISKDQEE